MAPGRRRSAKGLKSVSELSLGDLVLAKVKGFPAWPAKISRPEVWGKTPDPKKYFVYFFGTAEIAFVAPADVQGFTVEAKNKLSARCKGKPLRFTQAVKEICEEFEKLQQKKLNSSEDDTSRDVLGSEDCSVDADEDEDEDDGMEVDMKDVNSINKAHMKMGTQILDGSISQLERCSQKPGIMECEERKPCTSGNINGGVSPSIYGSLGTCKTDGPISLKKEVVSTASLSSNYLSKEEGYRTMKVEAHLTSVEEPNGACNTKEDGGIAPSILLAHARKADREHKEPSHGVAIKGNKSRQTRDGVQTGTSFDDSKKPSHGVASISERKAKKSMKGKNDEIRISHENDIKDLNKAELVRKKMNPYQGQLKQASRNNEVSHAAKRSNSSDVTVASSKTATQTNKKVESNSLKDAKRSLWKGDMKNHSALGVAEFLAEDEDALPPSKRPCRAIEISGERVRKNTAAPKIESSSVDNVKSPFPVATKRRAVRLCDDEEEEAPKTPIHAGSVNKTSHSVDRAKKNDDSRGNFAAVQVMKKKLRVEDGSTKELSSAGKSVEDGSHNSQKNSEKKLRKTEGKSDLLSPKRLVAEKASGKDGKTSLSSTKASPASVATSRPISGYEKPKRGDSTNPPDCNIEKRPATSEDIVCGESSSTSLNKQMGEKSKQDSISERKTATSKTSSHGTDAVALGIISGNGSVGERPSTSLNKQMGEKSKLNSVSERKKVTSRTSSQKTDAFLASGGVSGNGSVGETSSTSLNKQMGDNRKLDSILERKKSTSKTSSHGTDAVLDSAGASRNGSVPSERLEVSRLDKANSSDDLRISDPDTSSMRHLIAAAQEKRRQAHLQNLNSSGFFAISTHAEAAKSSPSSVSPILPLGSSSIIRPDSLELQAHSVSPSSDVRGVSNSLHPEAEQSEEKKVESGNRVTESSLSGSTEAAVARDAFEGMIETLSRTKESIGRATRLAIDCAKIGIANEVIELLIQKLQSENSMHRKVDLFFLVDSITQCSHNHKGTAGTSYIPIVQAALSRLLGAAAPHGAAARDNRRQCLKVLRLWQERKILPEASLKPLMDEIGVANDETSSGLSLRRPSRIQRAFDDPIRDMEGMFVDEYGSNATFQLAGFFSSRAFDDNDDNDEDEEIIIPINAFKEVSEKSPGEHTPVSVNADNQSVTPSEKRHRILEDVDGELEMEDVSVSLKDEMEDVSAPVGDGRHLYTCATTEVAVSEIYLGMSSHNSELPPLPEGSPPLPPNSPPQTPPLPSSPPPVLPRLPPTEPPPPPSPSQANPFLLPPVGPHSGLPSQHPLQPQPSLAPQSLQFPPMISSSPSVYQHQPSTNEILVPSSGNQITQIVATHGLHGDLPVRNDVYGQFPCFGTLEAGNPSEHSRSNASRPIEYSQIDAYGNPQSSQPSQQFQQTFAQTPVHPDAPTQSQQHHLAYPHSQHPYSQSFSLPNHPDASRLYVADDQWRVRPAEFNNDYRSNSWMAGGRSSSGAPFAHEGFPIPIPERPRTSTFSFQPPRPSTLPAGASISGHVISGQVDMHAHNCRPS